MRGIIGSGDVAGLIHVPSPQEPCIAVHPSSLTGGALVGCSAQYNIPVYIDPSDLMNPHMLICGMTGGGKTYFARSLISRLHMVLDCSIAVLDFTGEYISPCAP